VKSQLDIMIIILAKYSRIIAASLVCFLMMHTISSALADDKGIALDIQIAFLSRIATYDRNINISQMDSLRIGIILEGRNAKSEKIGNEFEAIIDEANILKDVRFGYSLHKLYLDSKDDIKASMKDLDIDILYVPELNQIDVELIREICRENKYISFTGIASYLDLGLSLCIISERNRPVILMNLDATRAEGARFRSQLIKICRLIE
jgi:hypothetical protein